MKKGLFFLAILFFMTACSRVTLIDVTLNSFSATASKDMDDRIQVSWITNGFFETYQVLRSYQENGTYVPVSSALSSDKFDDITAEKNTVYYYKVRAFNSLQMPLFTTPDPAEGLAGVVGAISAPTTLKVSVGESVNKIILTWERAKGAESYNIYRSRSPNFFAGEAVLITNLPYLRFEDLYSDHQEETLMNPGDVFYYKVASVDAFGSTATYPNQVATQAGVQGSVFGASTGSLDFSANPGAYADKIHLTWNHVVGTYQYQIFASENKNGLGSQIAMVSVSSAKAASSYSFDHIPTDKTKVYYYTLLLHGTISNVSQQSDEKAKGYLKSESAPAMPNNFTASQGEDARYVRLSWSPVSGATGYQVSRSANGTSGWEDIDLTISPNADGSRMQANDDPYTGNPRASFSYFYKVVALNPAPGVETSAVQGWANKAPANLTASKNYGGRVLLEWDPVPGAVSYTIEYSSAASGPFALAGEPTPVGSTARQQYSHRLDISPDQSRKLYYRISVVSAGDRRSDPSTPVEGAISKIQAPGNVQIVNNRTANDQFLRLSWDSVPNAQSYRIYRATLMHRYAKVSDLRNSDFRYIADVGSRAYIDSLVRLPIRRYQYKIVAIDLDDDEGAATLSEEAYRLPVSVREFLQDVDQTIIEAQTRIASFGNNGSSGTPWARATGQYFFAAGLTARSEWINYTSFEVSLAGNPSFSVNISTMTASQTGTVNVSGLYTGSVTYNALVGAMGGYTTGGSITARYKGLTETYASSDAAGFLESVRSTTEPPPSYPSYEKGGGGVIQPGGREQ
ncbi:MAG: hypothetical protein ACRCY4_10275 [Brevinema sp.]